MKTIKKISNPEKPQARFKIKKLNQFYYFCEHTFRKFKKKKKLSLSETNLLANEINSKHWEDSIRFDKLKVNIDYSEFKIISK
jgi:hypothetical protein